MRSASWSSLLREVLVLHLPGVVERVEGGVSDEKWQGPPAHLPIDLAGVVVAHRREVRLAILPKSLLDRRLVFGDAEANLLREVQALDSDDVANDVIAVASAPARA